MERIQAQMELTASLCDAAHYELEKWSALAKLQSHIFIVQCILDKVNFWSHKIHKDKM